MDVRRDAAVERDDVRQAAGIGLVAADDRVVRALEDADDGAFETARRLPLDAHQHAVAVHRFREVGGGDVDVLALRVLGHDEAETRGIDLQAPGDEVAGVGQRVPIAAHLRELARGCEPLEVALERDALVARHAQQARELARRRRMVHALLEEAENLVGGWHYPISATWTSPTFVPVGPVRSRSSSAPKK